jgi:ribosomal protein S18 acetylase RimI-like enzyme
MNEIRKAGTEDLRQVGRTMGRAFYDDPAFSWAAPNAERRKRFGPRWFESTIGRTYLPKGEVHMTDDGSAVAVWAPPDNWQTPVSASLPLLPLMLRATGRNLLTTLKMLTMMETRHKAQTEPHYYLPFIGTDPDHQGQGHGSALLAHMLRRCDEEGVPAYLESTSIKNQALYHRHGFKVLDEMSWPNGGPSWWPMWYEPRG